MDEHPDYVPEQHFQLVMAAEELTLEERQAAGLAQSVDEIEL